MAIALSPATRTQLFAARRPPSPLGEIQSQIWLPEYTTNLLDMLHVLGRLIALEPAQADLLDRICALFRAWRGE